MRSPWNGARKVTSLHFSTKSYHSSLKAIQTVVLAALPYLRHDMRRAKINVPNTCFVSRTARWLVSSSVSAKSRICEAVLLEINRSWRQSICDETCSSFGRRAMFCNPNNGFASEASASSLSQMLRIRPCSRADFVITLATW
jgi:hypothetical protein